jgi:oligoendopeptidase F
MSFETTFTTILAPTAAAKSAPSSAKGELGTMPEWDLSDLYKSPDDPAVQRDLEAAAKEAARIKFAYQGKLVALGQDGAKLAVAVKEFEKLCDLVGKLGSYSGLYYTQNQSDPARAKFNADVSEALTKVYTDLIFFELELNQIAFNRLFDETAWLDGSLRFEVEWRGVKERCRLSRRLTYCRTRTRPSARRVQTHLPRPSSDNIKLFTLITNTLAKDKEISDRWRNFKDMSPMPAPREPGGAGVVDALVEACARPIRNCRIATTDEGEVARQGQADALGPQCAAARREPERIIAWNEAREDRT